ncbi:CTD small phosphatase-like protein [Drosera capensis]
MIADQDCGRHCKHRSNAIADDEVKHGRANEETEVIKHTHSQGLLSEQNCQTKELQTTFISPATEGKEPTPFSCPSKYETIFSPVMSTFYVHSSEEIHDDEGSNIGSDPSNLTEADGNSGTSYENQTRSASDFYISDMVLAAFPSDDSALCDSVVRINPFLVYDTAASNILFDTDEGSMNLPFVDDSVDFINLSNTQPSRGTEIQSEDSSFLLAIHQISPSDAGLHDGACARLEHAECFDPHSFIRNLPELSDAPACQPTILAKDSLTRKPVTLVLDLDETLVHSTLEHCEDADFTFTVFYNMKEQIVYVKKRPHLQTFLERIAEMFEIIIFTASQSIYAAQLLDILDPDGKLISGRVYRESCIFSDGTYTKDLTVLGVDLAKVVIVDNSPQVFRLQVNNGIPIKSWFHDPSDSELISLIPFLETLVDADDVRPIIAEMFGNKG